MVLLLSTTARARAQHSADPGRPVPGQALRGRRRARAYLHPALLVLTAQGAPVHHLRVPSAQYDVSCCVLLHVS